MEYPKKSYYKYRSLFSDRAKRIEDKFTRSLIESCKVFYAAPSSFNDPYDCNLQLHANGSTDNDWIRYVNALITQYPNTGAQLAIVRDQQLWKTHPELIKFGEETRRKHYEESSVLCLSRRPDSIPMFSYYADSHHGVAIELTFSDDEIPCGFPCGDLARPDQLYQRKIVVGDVIYSPSLPELNYHRLQGEQLIKSLIFTKLIDWQHEEEFRILRRGVAASVVQLQKPMLSRVIFGARTVLDDIKLVKNWLAKHGHPVVFAKAEVSSAKFGLTITDFETYIP